ncbi:hypothetical protein [Citrobacter koseri]|uniref:hypothetical protein n=1 Tax=Citrobacter koseri TaxID=545 RepID=UPI00397D97C6
MKFNGTPGPWVAVQQYVDEVSVTDSQGFKVVTAERTAILMDWDKKGFEHWGDEGGSRHLSCPEQFSNAYLIAAAPDLLEALQDALCVMERHGKIFDPVVCKAREAIIKAIG